MRIGALETGGTKMVMGIFDEEGHLLENTKIPTRTPEKTMPGITAFFREQGAEKLGIGTFGPVDLREDSPSYGSITTTPKLDWRNYPLLSELPRHVDSANKCLATMGDMITKRGAKTEHAARALDAFRLHA